MGKHLVILGAATLFGVGNVCALPLSTLENSYAFLVRKAVLCLRPVPTEADPIRGSVLIAELREQGRLLERFKCGRCRYDLVGETEAAYYVKTCGTLTLELTP
jgi:hypothetical protein